MKTLFLCLALLVAGSAHQPVNAQVNVNINIGSQPIWGPTGYDYVQYYYMPDLDIYYYVPQQQWIYFQNGRWITATTLPPQYRNYDLYSLHKVVINDPQPYLRNQTYKAKYASFKGRHDQQPIRDSHDSRYFVIANHPEHAKFKGNQPGNGRGNQQGNGNGRDRGNGNGNQHGHGNGNGRGRN